MSGDGLPQPGEIIAGKLQVEQVIGRGGMGVVLAARHLILGQRVAVKFLLPEAMRLPEASVRFMREARAAVAIQSEHVARVLDVATLADGTPYMVMEFLSGTDLGKVRKQRGALSIEDAVDYVLQAGEAIAEAHALGIVHRDLKPGNLFLTARAEGSPLVKVLDFGLSKVIAQDDGASEASLTATGFVMGSPHYMSPEQVRSLRSVDARTDVWALGVILYEMLAGRRPFDGPSLTAVTASIAADLPTPLRALRPAVPAALATAISACLEKDADRRTPSVAALAKAIAPFAPARSTPSIERIARFGEGVAGAPEPASPVDPAPEPTLATIPMSASHEGAPRITVPSDATPTRVSMTSLPMAEPLADPVLPTSAAWGQTQPITRTSPARRIAAAGGVAAAVVIALLIWFARGTRDTPAASSDAPAVTADTPAASAIAVVPGPSAPTVRPSAEPAPIASAAPPPPAPAVTTSASARPAAPRDPKPRAKPPQKPPRSALDNPN